MNHRLTLLCLLFLLVQHCNALKRKRWIQQLYTGGASRAVAQMTLYPIDALRTLAQTRDGRTLADVGVKSLVRGSATTSLFALGMGSIQFCLFDLLKEKVGPLLASAAGAAGSCIVSVPQEVIKQRLVTGIYPSFRSAVASIARDEGLAGFYAAWKPTMARNVPFVMVTFTAMDWFKTQRLKRTGKKELGLWENVAIGMSAALVAGIVTQPVDVIKTRLMTQAASQQAPYKSVGDCFFSILRTEGIGTFYAGFRQRSTYMCLLWGITFALNGKFQQKKE